MCPKIIVNSVELIYAFYNKNNEIIKFEICIVVKPHIHTCERNTLLE